MNILLFFLFLYGGLVLSLLAQDSSGCGLMGLCRYRLMALSFFILPVELSHRGLVFFFATEHTEIIRILIYRLMALSFFDLPVLSLNR
jgi:hypothetical protein